MILQFRQIFFTDARTFMSHLSLSAVRDSLTATTYKQWDLAIYKNTQITERIGVQLRADFFNFLNHPLPTFTNKAPTQTELLFPIAANTNFGQTTFTAGRRTSEVAIKYTF